jgi:hypothetical protein
MAWMADKMRSSKESEVKEVIDMTTDEEITIEERFWQAHFVVCQNAPAKEDGRKIMLQAAVMMAKKLIAEARASERASWFGTITETEWNLLKVHETDTDKFTAGTARNICRLMNEAYAKGKADEREIYDAEARFAKPAIDRFDKLLRQEAYKKGQADALRDINRTSAAALVRADLIEKLFRWFKGRGSMERWQLDKLLREFVIREAAASRPANLPAGKLAVASESASSDSVVGETKQKRNSSCVDERSSTDKNARFGRLKANSAPENAFILGHCEKCNQMTNHSYNRETGDYACLKCKSKETKPEKKVKK